MALSYVTYNSTLCSPGTNTLLFGATVTAATDIIVLMYAANTEGSAITASDNLNGAYNNIGTNEWDSTNGYFLATYFVQASATGDPTVTFDVTGAYGTLIAMQFTGFAGIATADSGANYYNYSTSAAYLVATAVTAFNNEIMLALTQYSTSLAATPSGWGSPWYNQGMYAIGASAGTNFDINQAFTTSGKFDIIVRGIYDNTAPTAYPLPSQIYIMP